MNLNRDLRQIEQVGETAWELVMEGNFRAARRVIKKIKYSHCISESRRITTIIEAHILMGLGKREEAKTKILQNLGYLWGFEDGFEIIARLNPEVDADSCHYYIQILGGLATLGMFLQFSENHIASFDVVANSTDEALAYIDEVSNFFDPTAKLVLNCAKNPLEYRACSNRGVIRAYPFRLIEEGGPTEKVQEIN